MKKKFLLIFCLLIGLNLNGYSSAFELPEKKNETKAAQQAKDVYYTYLVKKELASEAEQINIFLSQYFNAFKTHNTKKLGRLYAGNYRSGDGYNKAEMLKLIQDGWEISSNLTYSSEIEDIRLNGNYAAVELSEHFKGSTKHESEITGDKGIIESTSKSIIHLARFGSGWKIVSDETLYEETSLKYGKARDFDINMEVPELVSPSNNYTISLKAEIPENMFALGSISREKLTAPLQKEEEVFRQVTNGENLLERVVKAGNGTENELAVAAISYCEVEKDSLNQPKINLAGTAVLIRRVNVMKSLSGK